MPKLLSQLDYMDAAKSLKCEVAAIKAVASVEAGKGGGFLSNNKPKILFESRWFNKLTNGKYTKSHPNLATETWVHNYYGGTQEYSRLEQACFLNLRAALKSTSWGMFQVLGANHNVVGWLDLLDFVDDMFKTERMHLDSFVGFIKHNNLDDELQNKDWAGFARIYNGPGFKKNNYDNKMAQSYEFYKTRPSLVSELGIRILKLKQPPMVGEDVRQVQNRLAKTLGIDIVKDGVYGTDTYNAVIEFQEKTNLIADGITGFNTKARLGI